MGISVKRPKIKPSAWVVYMLQCADGTLYTGITNDLPSRLDKHAQGKGAKYTRGRGPLALVFVEAHPNQSAALKREHRIKAMARAEKLGLVAATQGQAATAAMKPHLIK